MGLFGYNEKDYNRNTEIFKNRLGEVYQSLKMRGLDRNGAGQAITSIIVKLDSFSFPKGRDGKKQKAVDDRILRLVEMLENDAQQKNLARMILHANMITEAINDCRYLGKESASQDDIIAQEKMADCLGEIQNINSKKEAIEQQKRELLVERKRLEAIGATGEINNLRIRYMALENQEKNFDMALNSLVNTYNANLEILNKKDLGKTLGKLESFQVMNNQGFEHMLGQMSKDIEKNNMFVEGIQTAGSEFDQQYQQSSPVSSTGFDADYEQSKMNDAMGTIDSASYTPGAAPQQSTSGFDVDFQNSKF